MASRILIAEDNDTLRELYKRKLELAGYDVTAINDGAPAIAAVKKQAPDLMLCDIKMLTTDGLQVLEALPRSGRDFAIIMLSNFEEPETIEKAKNLGADDYFVKRTMTMRELLEKVANLTKAA